MSERAKTILDQPAGGPRAPDGATRREIERLGPWFHNLHLPGGIQTRPDHPLGDFPAYKWAEFSSCISGDLSGQTCLDVGSNAGFHGFECAKRGASVEFLDISAHFLDQARWAGGKLGILGGLSFRRGHVYDLARDEKSYDIVLFLGVFYHLRYPLLALDILARKTRRQMVFQTLTMPCGEAGRAHSVTRTPEDFGFIDRDRMTHPGWPKMAFIERKFSGDVTNWWAANPAACEAMLRSSGLAPERVGEETWVCKPDHHVRAGPADLLEAEYKSALGLW
ncbi:MAG: methyltransferase domain-containing protein [Phycisphaerae bacterium]